MIDGSDHNRDIQSESELGSVDDSLAMRALKVLAAKRAVRSSTISEHFILDLIRAVKDVGRGDPRRIVEDMLETRVSPEDVVDFYIPEVARRLGLAWCEDGISFADVTVGTARLQGMVHALEESWFPESHLQLDIPGLLVVVMPDEFHTLGAAVLGLQLRRMGASAKVMIGHDSREIMDTISQGEFGGVFVSVAQELSLQKVRTLLVQARTELLKVPPFVLGGSVVSRVADSAVKAGTDFATADPKEALRLCGLTISDSAAQMKVEPR